MHIKNWKQDNPKRYSTKKQIQPLSYLNLDIETVNRYFYFATPVYDPPTAVYN